MLRIFLVSSFLLIFSFGFSQHSISGKLIDDKNNPIASTEIILTGTSSNISTKTSSNGSFTFSDVASGNYNLTFKKEGRSQKEKVIVKNNDINTNLIFNSDQDNVSDIDEVSIIKVKSVKSELEKKGFAVNVIEMKEIETRNLQTVEVLDQSVGVRVRQNGGLGSNISLNINGMTGNAIRVLIDGIPTSSYGASFNLNSIPPAMIERIEVYKGVIPGYIADDALGGAINIILKKGARNTLGLAVSYGSFNTMQLDFNTSYRSVNGFTANISSFYSHSDNDYKVWGRGVNNVQRDGSVVPTKAKRFNDAFDAKGIVAEVGFTKVKWADQFLLGFNHSESYKEVQHGLFMAMPYKGRFVENNSNVATLQFSKKNFLLKNLDFNFNALYSVRDNKTVDTVRTRYNWDGQPMLDFNTGLPLQSINGAQQGAPTIYNQHAKSYSGRAAATYHINQHHRLVLTYFLNNLNRTDDDEKRTLLERQFSGIRDLRKSNGSLTYEFDAFHNKLKLSVFGKYYEQTAKKMDPVIQLINGQNTIVEQNDSRTVSTEGYGGAASYLLTPSIMLMGSAEKAVRMPDEAEVFGNPGENVSQNFTLRPEISNNFNLGFKLGPYRILNTHQISVATNGFVRDAKDKIMRFQTASNSVNEAQQVLPYINSAAIKSTGIDVELMYNYSRKLFLNYNISRFKSVFNKTGDSYENRQVANEPTFTMNANLQYVFQDLFTSGSRFNIFYNFRHVREFNSMLALTANLGGADYFVVPTQNAHDIGFSYQFPKNFIVSFDAKNILNAQMYDNFAVQRPGRAFYLKVNFNLNNLYK